MKLTCLKPRLTASNTSKVTGSLKSDTADSRRGTAHQRGYGHKWRVAREGWLRTHPLCEFCKRDGQIVAATVVDHIVPHRGDMVLFWDRNNWQSLCKPHHDGEKQRIEAQL